MNTSAKTTATPAVETPVQVTSPTSKVATSICDFVGVEPTKLFALASKLADKEYLKSLSAEMNSLEELEVKFFEILKELEITIDREAIINKVEATGIQFLEAVAVFIQTFAGQVRGDEFRETCMKAVVTFKMSKQSGAKNEDAYIAAFSSIRLWGFSGEEEVAKHKAKQVQLEIITSATPANEETKVTDEAASAISQAFTFG